ncbi:hypothetical protein [Solimonas variicoloris]|uniref:hypothetical protein n=1 Tax=Solimonas variicoloris TaxID=254408 RepID=UPI00039F407A|nr:hypothetical protein [Solimonas variicoloris]
MRGEESVERGGEYGPDGKTMPPVARREGRLDDRGGARRSSALADSPAELHGCCTCRTRTARGIARQRRACGGLGWSTDPPCAVRSSLEVPQRGRALRGPLR